ncbi:MAG: sigma-54 dependent transcriptional regulator [Gammaproteobacteria bacterium]|nr:sigma-54 dependent transcriptional regulator [Gammaproteobacteria bacterium]MDX2460903.1 sigma-54 dependent transcriptional regulator [Gammaproteobacteria bacterium]
MSSVINNSNWVEPLGDHMAGPRRSSAVLVVDDEPGMRNFLLKALDQECALVETADSVERAEELRQRYHFDLLIVDIRLPGRSGVEWLEELRDQGVTTDVIVMTAYADLETSIAALRGGASDFLLKPFRVEQMMTAVRRCLERRRITRENFLLKRDLQPHGIEGIVGASPAISDMCAVVKRVAPTASMVLIEGETGTGKELVAGAIHALSGRSGPFVPVNCGSISPELLESELFGHTKGAFTSAHSSREGLFSYAQDGTLFLDEISEMSLAMQAKLLRALEEKRVRPVGADREEPINARVIAATNRQLAIEMSEGNFREDLFFRLNVLAITVPPLREHCDDIPALASHFSSLLANELGVAPIPFAHEDIAQMQAYGWPGNVRELKNVIERSLLLGKLPGDFFTDTAASVKAGDGAQGGQDLPLGWTLDEVEKHHMLRVLDSCAGNKSRAARSLGVSRKTLERKLKSWSET